MAEVFEISVDAGFSAAHALAGHAGDCSRLHGHTFGVTAFVRCVRLDDMGMGVDFLRVRDSMGEILSVLDHRNLNELPAFSGENPTAENLARHVFRELAARLNGPGVAVSRVRVSEGPGMAVTFWEE